MWRRGAGVAMALAAPVALRFLLATLGATSALEGRLEIGTPANSLPRAREGLYLASELRVSPYSSSSFHGAPLLLPVLAPFIGDALPAWSIAPFAAADIASALLLSLIAAVTLRRSQIACAREPQGGPTARSNRRADPEAEDGLSEPVQAALFFLWNPLSILACVGGSSGCLEAPAVLAAVLGGALANPVLAAAGVACSAYLAPHHALLLIPVGIMVWRGPEDVHQQRSPTHREEGAEMADRATEGAEAAVAPRQAGTLGGLGGRGLACFLAATAAAAAGLAALSNASLRGCHGLGRSDADELQVAREWVQGAYGFVVCAEDLSPNIGLWWYLVTEVFDDFRPMFLFILNCQAALLAAPLALRFPSQPLLLAAVHCCTSAMGRAYPCLSDIALYMGFLPLIRTTVYHMRHGQLLITGALWISVLEPSIWHMWIHSAVANANFFYSVTLALGVGHIILISDLVGAAIRRGRILAGKPLVVSGAAAAEGVVLVASGEQGSTKQTPDEGIEGGARDPASIAADKKNQ